MAKNDYLLEVNNLSVDFGSGNRVNHAVEDVTFRVKSGEILGIVGESGSGKSVSSLSVMKLIPDPPGRITGGTITFEGEDIISKTEEEMSKIRGNKISMIFQEPMTSFNPVYTIGTQIIEAIMYHQKKTKKEAQELAIELLHEVGISLPEKRIHDYPHQMSGGMLQRAMIAMALSCDPELLIADEPTTALDVTIQAQIIDLLKKINKEREMSIIMITHDLGVIAEMAQYVVVMYKGRIVEESTAELLFEKPMHPYTQGLIKCIHKLGEQDRLYVIPTGDKNPTKGCRFCSRCEFAFDKCFEEEPPLEEVEYRRRVRCWLRMKEAGGADNE